MAKATRALQQPNPFRPNVWGFLRDVLVASMSQGLFMIAVVALLISIILIRMPQADVSKLAFEILGLFKDYKTLGWGITIVVVPTAGIFFNRFRRLHKEEINRLKLGK